MKRWTRSAPCKINLTLDILGRREDGYHDMYMVMQTVSLCDHVTVEESGERFSLDVEGLVLPDGVKSLEELPEINPVQLEEFKVQAEEEVQLTLNI